MTERGDWRTLEWREDGLALIDQRALPEREEIVLCRSVAEIAAAIEDLVVRGAPAVGCTAAYGIAIAARRAVEAGLDLSGEVASARTRLAATRPTAVNLFWALDRMMARFETVRTASPVEAARTLLAEACDIEHEDAEACRRIGRAGRDLVPDGASVLTHCNAGALATAAYGTALGVVRAAVEQGKSVSVLAGETRPFFQGARLTAWELSRDGVPVQVITDNMAAHMMQLGRVDLVVVGADRVAANGDVANKIGTYGLAVLADAHRVPFYVAAPCSTIDPDTKSGADIPIEERGRAEVAEVGSRTLVPADVPVAHPAFDVTPARYVTALVTDLGVLQRPDTEGVASLLREPLRPVARAEQP